MEPGEAAAVDLSPRLKFLRVSQHPWYQPVHFHLSMLRRMLVVMEVMEMMGVVTQRFPYLCSC